MRKILNASRGMDVGMNYDRSYFFKGFDRPAVRLWKKDKGKTLTETFRLMFEEAEIKKGDKVLDVGCGMGFLVVNSALKGAQVSAIDLSEDAIRLTRESLEYNKVSADLKVSQAENLPFESDSFDIVFFVHVIEHLRSDSVRQSLKEIMRVLKPGGKMIVAPCGNENYRKYGRRLVYLYKKLTGNSLIFGRDDSKESGHINSMTPKTFRETLERNGFRVEKFNVSFNPHRLNLIHKIVMKSGLSNLFCQYIYAVCKKGKS